MNPKTPLVKEYAKNIGLPISVLSELLRHFDLHLVADLRHNYFEDTLQDNEELAKLRNLLANDGYEFTLQQYKQGIDVLCYIRRLYREEMENDS